MFRDDLVEASCSVPASTKSEVSSAEARLWKGGRGWEGAARVRKVALNTQRPLTLTCSYCAICRPLAGEVCTASMRGDVRGHAWSPTPAAPQARRASTCSGVGAGFLNPLGTRGVSIWRSMLKPKALTGLLRLGGWSWKRQAGALDAEWTPGRVYLQASSVSNTCF